MMTPVLTVLGVVGQPGVLLVLSLHIPADRKHHDGALWAEILGEPSVLGFLIRDAWKMRGSPSDTKYDV